MFVSNRFRTLSSLVLVGLVLLQTIVPVLAAPTTKLRILVTGSNVNGMRYTLSHMADWINRSGHQAIRDEPRQRVKPPHDAVAYLEELILYSTGRDGNANVSVGQIRTEAGGNWNLRGRKVKPNITIVGPTGEILATTVTTPFARQNYSDRHNVRVRFKRTNVQIGLGATEGDSLADALDRYFAALPPLELPTEPFEELVGAETPGDAPNLRGATAPTYQQSAPRQWGWSYNEPGKRIVLISGPLDGRLTARYRKADTGVVMTNLGSRRFKPDGTTMFQNVWYPYPVYLDVWQGDQAVGTPTWSIPMNGR